MGELRIGQVINTEKGQEKIVAIEWGNPVTTAVDAMEKIVSAPRPVSAEAVEPRNDNPANLARFGSPAVSQLIKI